jgi:ABC-type cobalamin/Fe3+-siderophores transport system ATPase subunit
VFLMKGGRIVKSGPPGQVLRAAVLEPVYEVPFAEARAEGLSHPVIVPRA